MNITRREAFKVGIFAGLFTLFGRFLPKVEALTVPEVPLPEIRWEYLPTCKELNAMLAELRPHFAGLTNLALGGSKITGRPKFTKGHWTQRDGNFPVHTDKLQEDLKPIQEWYSHRDEDLSRRLRM